MILKTITLEGLKFLTRQSCHLFKKKKYTLYKIFSFNFQLQNCYCSNTSFGAELFDTVEVQNYLNYLTNKKSNVDFDRVLQLLEEKKNIETEMKLLENMSSENNKELEKLINSEKENFLEVIKRIKNDILFAIMPNTGENDDRDVELKIIPGIGGEESKNFSLELYQMYINYAEYKNWECLHDFDKSYILINGKYVYGHLKCEAGVHRVQRVPETEKSGRTHTSTCSVVVLPQPKNHEIHISQNDLIVEKLRSGGPGGQNVNKRESCVRIKHKPTGITIERQTSRFQFDNMKEAINELRRTLFNIEQKKLSTERNMLRQEQAGINDYSDKIRTYNFPQSRVTDHRISFTTQNLKGFLSGNKELDHVISQVRLSKMKDELSSYIKSTLESENYKNFAKQQR